MASPPLVISDCFDLFDAAPDGLIVVNRAGQIVLANTQAKHLLRYPQGLLHGLELAKLIPDDVKDDHVRHQREYQTNPYPRPMGTGLELRAVCYDGKVIDVEISLSPLHAQDEHECYTMAGIRDVSERKQRVDELMEQVAERESVADARFKDAMRRVGVAEHNSDEYHRALSHYTQVVRHRVANPIQVIQGLARTLIDMPELSTARRNEMIEAIDEAARRLADMTIFSPEMHGPEESELHAKPFE
jgi:PAS domain S-box-containing protein